MTAIVTVCVGLAVVSGRADTEPSPPALEARWRHPVAIEFVDDHLLVANARSGTISVVDPDRGRIVREVEVGRRLSDLAVLPAGRGVLVADNARHELRLLSTETLKSFDHVAVPHSPVRIAVARDGSFCSVTCLWSHRVAIVPLVLEESTTRFGVPRVVDVPFAPRALCIFDSDRTLIVADAFGGRFATIDVARTKVRTETRFNGHNVADLLPAPDGRQLLVAHQIANDRFPTERERVHAGSIIGNQLRSIPVPEFTRDDAPHLEGIVSPLGEPGHAAADPSAIAITKDGTRIVATAGTDEVHVRGPADDDCVRLPVGRRPTAIATRSGRAFVANELDDTITILDLQSLRTERTISLGPRPPATEVTRGEQLFTDGRLSLDGWMSCGSCHPGGHTNGRLVDNFSDGTVGTPKQTPSLLGTGDTRPWAWNAGGDSLTRQIHASITKTMRGATPTKKDVLAIEAYLATLSPPPSLAEARGELDESTLKRGSRVFDRLGCANCHVPPRYTNEGVVDVGLHDEAGEKYFNPPSLRGVSQRGPYYHDGRAASLRDVLTSETHADFESPDGRDLEDLLAFLRSL